MNAKKIMIFMGSVRKKETLSFAQTFSTRGFANSWKWMWNMCG